MCSFCYKFNVNDAKQILNGRIPDNVTQYNKLKDSQLVCDTSANSINKISTQFQYLNTMFHQQSAEDQMMFTLLLTKAERLFTHNRELK
jgi:hypothetical protein